MLPEEPNETTSTTSDSLTFVFTDIEGSTRKWEEYPDAMPALLERHDRLVRDAIESNGGRVFKTMGDAFCAAFGSALSAVQALQQATVALASQSWDPFDALRIRAAIHTGPALERNEDYFGPTINRVARLQAIGYGGQVLISKAVADHVGNAPLTGVHLKDLGSHRLKDLGQSEHVYQLAFSGLMEDFPPLRSLSAFANNLPPQMSAFVGREQEMQQVSLLLAQCRLVTLTGSGGTGKTRLALQVAAELLEEFGDGVWFLDLAPLSDPSSVQESLATVLGVRDEPGQALIKTLTDHLLGRKTLILMDNCEHVVSGSATLAQTLLGACPDVTILATSRQPLNIAGECCWRVPALSTPDPLLLPPGATNLEAFLLKHDAVRLFVDRLRSHTPNFVLGPPQAVAIAWICHRLDGVPLAIELAAARVRMMSLDQVHARLDDRFKLLTDGSRTALHRHQTLRALIDWSYDLLDAAEKTLLHRLSAFAGGCTLDAAESVCAGQGIDDWDIVRVLGALVDKSLVVFEDPGDAGRYRLLETVGEYAAQKLHLSGEERQVKYKLLEYFLAMAQEAEPHLVLSEQRVWLGRLEKEHDNLRAALAWSSSFEDAAEAGLRLVLALRQYWDKQGYWNEGREHLKRALSTLVGRRSTSERASALCAAGRLAYRLGDYTQAEAQYRESLDLSLTLRDKCSVASALAAIGVLAFAQGNYAEARALTEEALGLCRELDDNAGAASLLCTLGDLASSECDYIAARANLEAGLRIHRELGHTSSIAHALSYLGRAALAQGDYTSARTHFEEELLLHTQLGDKRGIGYAIIDLGHLAQLEGEYPVAQKRYEEGLALFRKLASKPGTSWALYRLGELACIRDEYSVACRAFQECIGLGAQMGDKFSVGCSLLGLAWAMHGLSFERKAVVYSGASDSLIQSLDVPRPASQQEQYIRLVGQTRAALGDDEFAAALAEGRSMNWEQAVALVLEA